MGYGYIALAYFIMMFPNALTNEFFSTSNLSLIGFAFLFMGLYQVQQRIQNRNLKIATICSLVFFIVLCFNDAKFSIYFAMILEPIIFLNILYGVIKECSEKTKKQIHVYTIIYLIMVTGIYLSLSQLFANTEFIQAMMVIVIFLRICCNIYFILLVLSINRQLKTIEPLPVHEKQIAYNKKHTMVMLTVILLSAGILYGTQGLYITSMQVLPSSDYENRIYEGTQANSRIAGQMRISKNQNVSDYYDYGQVNLYTKDETIAKRAKLMRYHLYMNEEEINEESGDQRFMKTDIVKVEKQSNGEYRIAFCSDHDMIGNQTDSASQVSMRVELYDEQENMILNEKYLIHECKEHIYHGSAHGITITNLYAGNTTILQAPIIQTNILEMAKTKGYTQVEMYVEYLQQKQVVAESNTILLDDIPWAPYVHQHMFEPEIRTSWDDTVMAYEQTIAYDQVILVMKYRRERMVERTFDIPLQESKP